MKKSYLILYFILSILLTIAAPLSDILMPLVLLLSSALMIAMATKWNVLYSVFSAAFSGAAMFFLFDSPVIAFTFPAICLVSALATYIALKLKATVKTVILAGTAGYFMLIAAVYLIFGGGFIADILNFAKNSFMESINSVIASIPTGSDISLLEETRMIFNAYFESLKVIAPSIILSLFFLISYFALKLSELFAKKDPLYSFVPAFSELHALPVFLLIGVISYFGQLAENTFVSGLMANVFMALSVYYTLCGFSLFDFFLKFRVKSIGGRAGIFAAGLILLSLVSTFFYLANPVLIAMFMGMADSIFNYRLRIRILRGK